MSTTPSFTLCELSRLSGAITATSAAVNGTVAFIDLGQQARQYSNAVGATDTSAPAAYGRFNVVFDVGVLDVVSGDERYTIELQGATDSAFTSPYRLGAIVLGHSSQTGNASHSPSNCRRAFTCDNRIWPDGSSGSASMVTRYVRLRVVPAGTTPSITITGAWLLPA